MIKQFNLKLILSFLMMAFLCGCSGIKEPSAPQWILNGQQCTVTVSQNEIKGKYTHSLEGVNSFSVEYPNELLGMNVSCMQDEYTIEVQGISNSRSGEAVKQSVFYKLFTAFNDACVSQICYENGKWNGELSGGEEFFLETDENGNIKKFSIPALQLIFTAE